MDCEYVWVQGQKVPLRWAIAQLLRLPNTEEMISIADGCVSRLL